MAVDYDPAFSSGTEPATTKVEYARLYMPKAFARNDTIPTHNGGSFDLLTVTVPSGTQLNGQDIGGWRIQQGYSGQYKRQFSTSAKTFTLYIPLNRNITLHKYDHDTKTDQKMEVNPRELVTAVKAEQEAYRQEHPQQAPVTPAKGMSR